MRFHIPTALKVWIVVLWVVTPLRPARPHGVTTYKMNRKKELLKNQHSDY